MSMITFKQGLPYLKHGKYEVFFLEDGEDKNIKVLYVP